MTVMIAFAIWCLLQSTVYCFPTPTAATAKSVQAVPDIPRETLDAFKNTIIGQLEELKYADDKDIKSIDQAIKDLLRKKEIDEKKHRKYSEHHSMHKNGKGNGIPPSNTVVTTIFVVATETPANIYSGNGGKAAKQQGSSQHHQVDDPNSASSTSTNQTEAKITEQMLQDQSAYHKLVTALSVVGGVVAISLVAAGFIYTRIRIRRKKSLCDLEKASSRSASPPPMPPHRHRPRSPSLQERRLSSITFDDGNRTVIGYSQQQNPFADSNSIHPFKSDPDLQSNDLLSPLHPAHLESRSYISYRQNQTLSMLSQTTATASPSAPTAKELGTLRDESPLIGGEYESTSEEENYHQEHQVYPSIATTRIGHEPGQESRRISHTTFLQAEPHRPTLQQQQALQKSESSFSSLPPPPAYTPSAVPSAPPLYALPTITTNFEEEQQHGEEDTLRRHSISSCSILSSSSRFLLLRRGSGSQAHISTTMP